MVKVNGEEKNVAGISVAKLVNDMNYNIMQIAVEINGDIVPKAKYEETIISDEDSIEVVSFVGGG